MRKSVVALVGLLGLTLLLLEIGLKLSQAAPDPQEYFFYLPYLDQTAPVYVSIYENRFVPENLNVRRGGLLVWTNTTTNTTHTLYCLGSDSTGQCGWHGVRVGPGQSFVHIPLTLGSFAYYSSYSPVYGLGFVGRVTVVEDYPVRIPNLSVFKGANKDKVNPGDSLTYSIYLDNSSTKEIAVTVIDTIPANISYISSIWGGAVYSPTINSVLWSGSVGPSPGTIPSQALIFNVRVNSGTSPFTNTVEVSSGSTTMTATAKVGFYPTPTPTPTPTSTPTPGPTPTPTPIIPPWTY